MVIAIQISTKKAQAFLSNLQINMEAGGIEISRESAKEAARQYKLSAKQAGIESWRGNFYRTLDRQIQTPKKLGKFTYGVGIGNLKRGKTNYFIALDRMKGHGIKLRKNRIITKWAKDKLGIEGRLARGIWVEPHPFIKRADRKTLKKIPKIAKKIIKNKARKSKR
ncbi:MAG: hypothetical protein CL811_06660 [Colwelliaceae bacterium]|nr:hypothetical protein [Colwelliaceae bacterium]